MTIQKTIAYPFLFMLGFLVAFVIDTVFDA
jgi:hypothetical protein